LVVGVAVLAEVKMPLEQAILEAAQAEAEAL
jgi:hypothetical protein